MVDYLKWKQETEAKFSLKASLDGVSLFGHTFDAKNIFSTFTHFVPIDSIPRKKVVPLTFDREDQNGRENTLYYDMSLKYFVPTDSLPPRDEGITITRDLFALTDTKDETPIAQAKVGDIVKGKLTLIIPEEYKHVAIADMIPAGFEIVNFNLDTEDQSLLNSEDTQDGYNNYGEGVGFAPVPKSEGFFARIGSFFSGDQVAQVYDAYGSPSSDTASRPTKLYPSHIESHDDRIFLYVTELTPGVYTYEYYLRALVPGTFKHLPARAEELYFPEVFGRTSGDVITVTEK
jgi:uncharacterized protein YfaS (alpha-2-macroglobulin family)